MTLLKHPIYREYNAEQIAEIEAQGRNEGLTIAAELCEAEAKEWREVMEQMDGIASQNAGKFTEAYQSAAKAIRAKIEE